VTVGRMKRRQGMRKEGREEGRKELEKVDSYQFSKKKAQV
jgi:hypothetical protein